MERVRTCPICRRALDAVEAQQGPYRPFCSQRCKTIDLGGWLDGRYKISRPVDEERDVSLTRQADDADDTDG